MQVLFRFCFIFLLGIQTFGVKNAKASEGFEENVEEGGFKTVSAQTSGQLTSINVRENQWVDEGQVLGFIEQMKMERPIVAPYSGYVTKIFITPPLKTRPYPMRSLEPILVLKRASQAEPATSPLTTPNSPIGRENGDGESTRPYTGIQGGENQQFANTLLLDEAVVEIDSEHVSDDSILPQKASVPFVSGFFFSPAFLNSFLLSSQVHETLGQDVIHQWSFWGSELEINVSSLLREGGVKNGEHGQDSRTKDQKKSRDAYEVQGNDLQKKTLIPTRVYEELGVGDSYVHGMALKSGTYRLFALIDPLLKELFFQIHLPSVHTVMWSWVLLFSLLLAQEESLLLKLSRRLSSKLNYKRGAVLRPCNVSQNSNSNRKIKDRARMRA